MICAGGCGKTRTPGAKYRDDHWVRGHCPACYERLFCPPSTERTRKYRSDPEKRERDREWSRRWKQANRERNQQRDREYRRQRRAA